MNFGWLSMFAGYVAFSLLTQQRVNRNLNVLLTNSVKNIVCGKVSGRKPIRIKPDPHGVVSRANHQDIADSGNPCQLVFNMEDSIVECPLVGPTDTYMRGVGDCFCVVTPNWRTSSGRRERASLTRFCTRTAAVSGSTDGRNVTIICRPPSEATTDFMYMKPSAPLMASSEAPRPR